METQNSVISAHDSGERTRENHKPGGSTIYKLVGISFGLLCIIQSSVNVYMWLQVDENSNKSKNSSTCNFTSMSADGIRGVLLERDQLLREKEQLNQYIDQLLQNKDKLLDETSQLNGDKNQLLQEKDKLLQEKAQLNQALLNLPRCSPEWKSFRSSCYHLSSFASTWENAKQNCERHEAHLVIISDDAEKNFVSSYGHAVNFWIGLKHQWDYVHSMWTSKWVDGTQLHYNNFRETSYTHRISKRVCVHQRGTLYTWFSAQCNKKYYWMCEKELSF